MKGEKVIDSKFIDSSVWIACVTKKSYSEIIDSEERLFLSVLSIFEIKKKLIKDNITRIEIEKNMKFIKEKSIIMIPTIEIAEKVVEISYEKDMPAIDSIIYSTALLNKIKLLTLDNDFRGLENVEILELK